MSHVMSKTSFCCSRPDAKSSPQLRSHIRQVVAERVAQEHTRLLQQVTQQAVENASSDILFTDYTKAERRLKKASYRFIKTVLTDMAEKGTIHNMLDRRIERWTHPTMFRNAFAVSFLSSPCFTQPIASIVRKRMRETADECRLKAIPDGFSQPDNVHSWRLSPPPLSSIAEVDREKHCRNKRKSKAPRRRINPSQRARTPPRVLIETPTPRSLVAAHPY